MAEEKKQNTNEAELAEITTQTEIAFKLEDGRYVDEKVILLEIYKSIKKLERGLL